MWEAFMLEVPVLSSVSRQAIDLDGMTKISSSSFPAPFHLAPTEQQDTSTLNRFNILTKEICFYYSYMYNQ